MSFFEFPHTRTYDSDLGWIIKTVKMVSDEYYNLVSWMNTHKSEYRELDKRVRRIEVDINNFESEMQKKFDKLSKELSTEIYTQLQIALAQINESMGNIAQRIEELRQMIERNRIYAHQDTIAFFNLSNELTDRKIQDLIDSIPDLTTVNVFNPVRGYVTSIQVAVDDLYDLGRSDGLTALEYDSIGLTASEYDALELTALQYDQYARRYIERAGYIKNPFHYMASPFTGEIVPLQNVISDLAALHKLYALTATEYDQKELTAAEYDQLELSAYDYDWHAKQHIA